MVGLSVRIFRVFGIDVKIDLSWAIIAIFIAWALAQGILPQLYEGFGVRAYWWMALIAVFGLAFSIILHELAHSLVAKALGTPPKSITLFIFGGVAELIEEPKNPLSEFLMAVAGPLTSVALALIFGSMATEVENAGRFAALGRVFDYLSLINWALAVFNMLPALPLDGGHVLRAIVWAIKHDITAATRVAARAGPWLGTAILLVGFVGALLGQYTGGLWWVMIGFFIRSAAQGYVVQEQLTCLFRGAPVREFMTPNPICAPPDASLRTFVDDFIYKYYFDLFPVCGGGKLLGAMSLTETRSVSREVWDRVKVGEVMASISDSNTIEVKSDAMDAFARMHKHKLSRLIVVENGQAVGMLALKDLLDLLNLKLALEGR